jgi:hypothetical protein
MYEVLNSQPVKPHNVRYDVECRDLASEERKVKVLEDYAAAEMLRQIPGGQPPGCRALLR